MAFDFSKLGSLAVPLNVSVPSTSTSGVIDTAPISNESHTGTFQVGGSGSRASDTYTGPNQTGGSAAGGNSPKPYLGDTIGQGISIGGILPAVLLMGIGIAVFMLIKRGRI
jgi:hypothetical protein